MHYSRFRRDCKYFLKNFAIRFVIVRSAPRTHQKSSLAFETASLNSILPAAADAHVEQHHKDRGGDGH